MSPGVRLARWLLPLALLLEGCQGTREPAPVAVDTIAPVTAAHPPGGRYGTVQLVTLAGEEASTVYWELEGAALPPGHPSSGAAPNPVYWIRIPPGTTTLRYFAVDGSGNREVTRTETYLIEAPTP